MMAKKWTDSFREPNSVRNARREKALADFGIKYKASYANLKGGLV